MSVFRELGVEPIINVSGAVTRLGGAPMPARVLEAFCAAAAESVPLELLQVAASRAIAEATGAEAGLVTSGAAAGLTLGAAAILAGYDLGRIERLPHTEGFPHEFVVAREHRNGYDHAVRAAGARLVEVGFHEPVAGAGVRRVEAWEYAAAFGPATAGVLYVYGPGSRPPLAEVVRVAHERGLKVLVDAAGELPPRSNLREIVATGADLVAFSGGKAIRGPQASGILCGKRSLVGAAALNLLDMDDHYELWEPPAEWFDAGQLPGLPRHGIGRALKVSKEQIAALLTALRLFNAGSYEADLERFQGYLKQVAASLEQTEGVAGCRLTVPADGESLPILEIHLDESVLGRSALEVCRSLRKGMPPVYVGHGRLDEGILVMNPLHLNELCTQTLIRRLTDVFLRR